MTTFQLLVLSLFDTLNASRYNWKIEILPYDNYGRPDDKRIVVHFASKMSISIAPERVGDSYNVMVYNRDNQNDYTISAFQNVDDIMTIVKGWYSW